MSRMNHAKPATRVAGDRSARRRALLIAAFGCEALEGRQLMAAGIGAGLSPVGDLLPVDIGAQPVATAAAVPMATSQPGGTATATPVAATPVATQGWWSRGTAPQAGGMAVTGTVGAADLGGLAGGFGKAGGGMMAPGGAGDAGAAGLGRLLGAILGGQAGAPEGAMTAAPGGTTSRTGSTPANDAVAKAVAQLGTDLQALAAKSQVTVAERTALEADLQADAKAATAQATPLQVAQLETDLLTAEQTGTLNVTQLMTDQAAVLTARGVSSDAITKTQADEQTVITSSGVTGADLKTIYADQQAIRAAIKAQAPTTPTPPTTTDPAAKAAEQLRTDQQALDARSQVTVAQTVALANDAKAVKAGATTAADPTALTTLQGDLKAALAGGTLNFSQLLTDQAAVLKSEGVSASVVTQTQADEQAVFAASGITQADLKTISADQQALAAALQPQLGSSGTAPGAPMGINPGGPMRMQRFDANGAPGFAAQGPGNQGFGNRSFTDQAGMGPGWSGRMQGPWSGTGTATSTAATPPTSTPATPIPVAPTTTIATPAVTTPPAATPAAPTAATPAATPATPAAPTTAAATPVTTTITPAPGGPLRRGRMAGHGHSRSMESVAHSGVGRAGHRTPGHRRA